MLEKTATEVALCVQVCKGARMVHLSYHGLLFSDSVIQKSPPDGHRALLLLTAHRLQDSSLCLQGCPLYSLDTSHPSSTGFFGEILFLMV